MPAKVQTFFKKFFDLFFIILAFFLVIATMILDKKVVSEFPNTVKSANVTCYCVAAILLLLIFLITSKLLGLKDIPAKSYIFAMVVIPLIIFGGVANTGFKLDLCPF